MINLPPQAYKEIEALVYKHIYASVQNSIVEHFIPRFADKCIELYDYHFVAHEGNIGDKDPTSPSNLRPHFMSYIRGAAPNLIEYKDNEVVLNDRYYSDLSLGMEPSKTETNHLKLLYFYFVGIIGQYVFIDMETLEKMANKPKDPAGRFGEGFFMPAKNYKPKEGMPSLESVKSPLSGRQGVDIIYLAFLELESELREIISKAISGGMPSGMEVSIG